MSTKQLSAPLAPQRTPTRNSTISLAESARIAHANLLANKLRSVLTALGVIIGVAAVVALLAIGRGAQAKIAESITINGANLLTVRSGSLSAGGFGSSGGKSRSLTMDDAEALQLQTNVPGALAVSPETSSFGSIVVGSTSTSALVTGVTPGYQRLHNVSLARGAFFNEGHGSSAASVAVLGERVATSLFGQQNPVGQSMRIEGQRFRVIGVLNIKGGSMFGSLDDAVLVPLKTAQTKLFGMQDPLTGRPTLSAITVQASSKETIGATAAAVEATLRRQHKLATGTSNDFSIDNQQDLINTLTESQRTLTLYLGAIAAISLVVGGIGIMNMMLVSVQERTREIGLRKALGARERDILTQFLIEALVLSTSGGLLGLLLGVVIALVVDRIGQSRAILGGDSMLLAVGFAMMVGLFFGIEPARRAAQLDPINALRSD